MMLQETFDVVVVGFGTAGALAAIAAGRAGASVRVIEPLTYPGGTFTGGGVTGFYGRHPYGLTTELDATARTLAKERSLSRIEALKLALETTALQAGCRLAYQAFPYRVLMAGRKVVGVCWKDHEGLHETTATVVIDATGDGRVCQLAGCPMMVGRRSDGRCNPFTNSMLRASGGGVHVFNFDAGRINPYEAESYSRIQLESSQDHLLADYGAELQEPTEGSVGQAAQHQVAPADLVGLREGGHVVTETVETLEAFFDGAYEKAEDVIAYAHSNIDTHANDMPLESTVFQDWMIGASMWGTELWFPVLRGTLVPKGYQGLLVAGRHLGVDHDLGQAIRMNDHCARIGEAAGVMAALAVSRQGDVMAVPFADIRVRMEQMPDVCVENNAVWSLDEAAIREGLASDKPGFAVWSARRQKLVQPLARWYGEAEDGSLLQCHAAMALALLGDGMGLPALRRMAARRDEYAPTTSRKYNHKRGYVAVYCLGRLADAESVPLLKAILADADCADKYEYHGHAVAALLKIASAHLELKADIYAFLRQLADDENWQFQGRLKGTQTYRRIDYVFREYIRRKIAEE